MHLSGLSSGHGHHHTFVRSTNTIEIHRSNGCRNSHTDIVGIDIRPFIHPFRGSHRIAASGKPPCSHYANSYILHLFHFTFLVANNSSMYCRNAPPTSAGHSAARYISAQIPLHPAPLGAKCSTAYPGSSCASVSIHISTPLDSCGEYGRSRHANPADSTS